MDVLVGVVEVVLAAEHGAALVQDEVGSAQPQSIVSAASYKAFGPLASLALGNGLSEIRSFDPRYRPAAVDVPGRLDQRYTTDPMGNILSIDRAVGAERFVATYGYQAPQ